jgi:hypothetical protein
VLPEFQRSFGESLPSFTKSAVCWQFCWQLQLGSSQLVDAQLVDAQASKLEARVGIGRFTSVFTKKIYAFSPMNASTFALLLTFPNELINYPLTEGFTETFTEDFLAHARM